MKKSKLKLNKQTIKVLTPGQLANAVGGASAIGCTSGAYSACLCTATADCLYTVACGGTATVGCPVATAHC